MLKNLMLFGFIISILLGACVGIDTAIDTSSSKQIVYILSTEPGSIDPHITDETEIAIPLRQIYDTLIYRDPQTKNFVPGLAESWSVSSDGLVYTLNLKQGVIFHNGEMFDAQAVGSNFDRILQTSTNNSKSRSLLGTYERYEIIDTYTIRLILRTSYSPFLDALSQPYLGIASPSALADYSTNRYQFHQVGTGPFYLEEYVPGNRIIIRRNESYTWGPSFYSPQEENSIEVVEFRFIATPSGRFNAINIGSAQIVNDLLPSDARGLTANSTIQVIPVRLPGMPMQFLINTTRFPTDNLVVRQALLYASNRNIIADTVFQRFSSVAWGPITPATLFYDRSVEGIYATDIITAQELLSESGYQDTNQDGILDLGGVDLEVVIMIPPGALTTEVAQLLQDQWRAIGVRTILDPLPTMSALESRRLTNDYNLIAISSTGLDPVLLNSYFLSSGINNWSRFTTPQLDSFLVDASQRLEFNVRGDMYSQLQQYIMSQAVLLPIREAVILNASVAEVQNVTFDAYAIPILNNFVLID